MINLDSLDKTYEYLSCVYQQTKEDFIKRKAIKSEKDKGLNVNSLYKYNLLVEFKDKYKWNGAMPRYALAYDYWNYVRGRKKKYTDLLTILKDPTIHKSDDILEAIGVTGREEEMLKEKHEKVVDVINMVKGKEEKKETGKQLLLSFAEKQRMEEERNETMREMEKLARGTLTKPKKTNVVVVEKQPDDTSSDAVIQKLMEKLNAIDKRFEDFENETLIIRELLGDLVQATMGNMEATKNSQNPKNKVIPRNKTNQDNLFDISATLFNYTKEIYQDITNKISDFDIENNILSDEKRAELKLLVEKRGNLGIILQNLRKRIEANALLITKYGNGNGK